MGIESILATILDGKLNEPYDLKVQRSLSEIFSRAAATLELKEAGKEKGNDISKTNGISLLLERIKQAKSVFDWNQITEILFSYVEYFDFGKSQAISKNLREKGNQFYKSGNGAKALRSYTLSLAFAPTPSSEELTLAFANRSAVLLQIMSKPKEALEDVQRALSNLSTCPLALKKVLEERKSKCQLMMDRATLSKQSETKKLFHIQEVNPEIPDASSFVKIKHNPEKGRHLIVTRDVPVGTVLMVDKPFCSVLNNLLGWETYHCHNCSKVAMNPIPCNNCTFALFCDEKCRDEACNSKGGKHTFEHEYLPFLRVLNSSHGDIQALRILSIVGRAQLYKLWKNEQLANTVSKNGLAPGFNAEGIFDTTSYLPIFHLISHESRGPGDDEESLARSGHKNALKALFLTHLLKEYSNFFEGEDDDFKGNNEKDDFEDFTASLILKHLESLKYNAISLSKLTNDNQKSVAYAAAVYPLLSLCNHSCDPNCVPVKQSKYLTTSLIALKHLRAGEELTITYKPLYTHMNTKERQKFLSENYRFICKCEACEKRWDPDMLLGGNSGTVILQPSRCPNCPMLIENSKKSRQSRQCHECVKKDVDLARSLETMEESLFECHDLLLKQKEFEECLHRLPQILDYFGKSGFSTHFQLYNVAIDLFKRALVLHVNDNY